MRKAICTVILGGLASLDPGAAVADAGVVVAHHDILESVEYEHGAAGGQQKPGETTATLSFDALGRRFDLRLEPNDRLLSTAARNRLAPGIAVYRGTVEGLEDSWVRIVMADGGPRGVIWDGKELLAIEVPGDSAVAAAAPVIYRLADAYVLPGTMTCGTQEPGSAASAYGKLVGELQVAMAAGPGASRQIDLGAVGDFELFERFNSSEAQTETAILSRLNTVDGIYSEQLGVQINVETIEVFAEEDDPFTAAAAGPLLDEVGMYRQNSAAQRAQGLTHLYTGRDLTGTTVGIAYLDALCSARFGAGLSEGGLGAMFASLIAAHEIGHNFGAEHDAEADSVCESAPPGFLMEASVNGNSEFSQCSLDSINPNIADASCITSLPIVDLDIVASGNPSQVLLGEDASLAFTTSNAGTQSATAVEIDIDLPENVAFEQAATEFGTCTNGAGTVTCSYGTVPGNSSRMVTLTTIATDVGEGTFTATVSADTDVNPDNNEALVNFTVLPAVDLVVNAIPAVQSNVDETFDVVIGLENRSSFAATTVEVSISLNSGLRAEAATWAPGTCTVTARQVDCAAAELDAQTTSSLTLSLTGAADGATSYSVAVSSAEDDADAANNSTTASVQVGPASVPGTTTGSSGGGGGATGWLPLVLLGGLAGFSTRCGSLRR